MISIFRELRRGAQINNRSLRMAGARRLRIALAALGAAALASSASEPSPASAPFTIAAPPAQVSFSSTAASSAPRPAASDAAGGAAEPPPRECVDLSSRQPFCAGEVASGPVDLVLDRGDWFSSRAKVLLRLSRGGGVELLASPGSAAPLARWEAAAVRPPVETVDERCFALQHATDFPLLLCAATRLYRDFWVNAAHELYFCAKTGVPASLPLWPAFAEQPAPAEAGEKNFETVIKVPLINDEAPELFINGKGLHDILGSDKREAELAILPPPAAGPKLEDVVNDDDNAWLENFAASLPEEPPAPPTLPPEALEAYAEAAVEAGRRGIDFAPGEGFFKKARTKPPRKQSKKERERKMESADGFGA